MKKEATKEKARMCVDYKDEDSFKAIKMLREAGFIVTATPVSGQAEPELTLGSTTYRGITEIQQFIQHKM